MDFINRLRQKPASAKRNIAITTSAVVSLAIFGLWVTVFHFGINQNNSNATASVIDGSDAADVNPLSAFWAVLSQGWGGLAKNIDQVKTGTEQAQSFVTGLQDAASTTPQPSSQKDVFIISGTSANSANTGQ